MPAKATTKTPAKQRPTPDRVIERWAQTICANDGDASTRMSALLLLCDELERSFQDWMRVEEIASVVRTAAFCKSDEADRAARKLVAELRAQGCVIKAA